MAALILSLLGLAIQAFLAIRNLRKVRTVQVLPMSPVLDAPFLPQDPYRSKLDISTDADAIRKTIVTVIDAEMSSRAAAIDTVVNTAVSSAIKGVRGKAQSDIATAVSAESRRIAGDVATETKKQIETEIRAARRVLREELKALLVSEMAHLSTSGTSRGEVRGGYTVTTSLEVVGASRSAGQTPEFRKNVQNSLDRLRATRPCARCGQCEFQVLNGFLSPMLQSTDDNRCLPCVIVACVNCGHVWSHALGMLGV